MVKIKRATFFDVLQLRGKLRQQDIEEVWASNHLTPHEALKYAFMYSAVSWVAMQDGEVICAFGCAPLADAGGASPWLLGSDKMSSLPVTFFRRSKQYIQQMLEQFGYLENYVDERNTLSKQWLEWLGFTIEDVRPYGLDNMPFHKFWLRRC